MKKILAFSGSNSSKSINQQLVRLAASKIADHEVKLITIRDYPLPVYGIDLEETEGFPEAALKLKECFRETDAFLVSSPEHNGLIPVAFKNVIDWLSRIEAKPFGGKPLLLMSTSPGPRGGQTNLANLEKVLPYQGANIVSTFSLPTFYETFDVESQTLRSEEDDARLTEAVKKLEESL